MNRIVSLALLLSACDLQDMTFTVSGEIDVKEGGTEPPDLGIANPVPPGPIGEGAWESLLCQPIGPIPTEFWYSTSLTTTAHPTAIFLKYPDTLWRPPEDFVWTPDFPGTVYIFGRDTSVLDCLVWEWIEAVEDTDPPEDTDTGPGTTDTDLDTGDTAP
jgi:hypothetical protein